MLLSSCAFCLLFSFASVHSLFFADAQRVTTPALRQAETRERERFRGSKREKRGKKKGTRENEKVPAEALRRSPSPQVQLLKLFQMCVQRFTSSADRSEPHSGTITGFTSSYFPHFPLSSSFSLSVSCPSSPDSLYSSHVMRCSDYQRKECTHTCTTQQPEPFTHWWNLQRIKERKGGERYSMCVCVQETQSEARLISRISCDKKKTQQKLAGRETARKRRSELLDTSLSVAL